MLEPVISELGIPGLTPGGIGIWTGVFILAGKWIVERTKMRKIGIDGDAGLIAKLMQRVLDLETALAAQIVACAKETLELRNELNAMRRQFVHGQITTAMGMPSSMRSAEMERAVNSMIDIENKQSP